MTTVTHTFTQLGYCLISHPAFVRTVTVFLFQDLSLAYLQSLEVFVDEFGQSPFHVLHAYPVKDLSRLELKRHG